MEYLLSYVTLGMFLAVVKSPIRQLVDWEVADLKMHCLIKNENIYAIKSVLLRLILSVIVVAFYPVILFRKMSYHYQQYQLDVTLRDQQIEAELSWLGDEVSIEDAAAANMVWVDGQYQAFGNNNSQWLIIQKLMQKEDRLYQFRSPDETWDNFAGKEGVALVRNGDIIADLVILLN